MGRRTRRGEWLNLTTQAEADEVERLNRRKHPATVEVGTAMMLYLAKSDREVYKPTLGGYKLQDEWLGAWRQSVDNIREIAEQLGKPFWIEATRGGILFHWNGTLGKTESYLALGFVLGVRHRASRALADICTELGHGSRSGNRRLCSGRWKRGFIGTLFHDRSIRTWNVPSRKRWTEKEAALA